MKCTLKDALRRLHQIVVDVDPASDPSFKFRGALPFEENTTDIGTGENRHREFSINIEGLPRRLSPMNCVEWVTLVRVDLRYQISEVMGSTDQAIAFAAARDLMRVRTAIEDPNNWEADGAGLLFAGFQRDGGREVEDDEDAAIIELYYQIQHEHEECEP